MEQERMSSEWNVSQSATGLEIKHLVEEQRMMIAEKCSSNTSDSRKEEVHYA
jgi:hypothetical protein